MDAHRRRLQEQHDVQAAAHAEQQKIVGSNIRDYVLLYIYLENYFCSLLKKIEYLWHHNW